MGWAKDNVMLLGGKKTNETNEQLDYDSDIKKMGGIKIDGGALTE